MSNLANVGSSSWSPWLPFGVGLGIFGFILAGIILIAIIVLKGYALWTAAKRNEKWWFIIMLVINTLGILELIYLFFVAKKGRKVGGQA